MDLPGLHTQHQGVQAGHHQALNMVGVAMGECLRQRVAQAGHVGLAGPVPLGQILPGIQCVPFEVLRHPGPVDATHIHTHANRESGG